MSPRPGGDVTNSSEFATMGSGEWRSELQRRRSAGALALQLARSRTGLILVLTYIVVTVVARMQDVWFYRYFRVNIFNYSDPEDFFLASMKNPAVWIYFLIPGAIVLLVSWLLSRRQPLPSQHPPAEGRGRLHANWNTPALRLALGVMFVIAAATAITGFSAKRRFDAVKSGRGRHVTFTRTDGVNYNEQPLLLGTTGTFFFLYYARRRVTEIVPIENTALMTVDLHPKKADSPVIPPLGSTDSSPRLSP
jgi:hypothetical protein